MGGQPTTDMNSYGRQLSTLAPESDMTPVPGMRNDAVFGYRTTENLDQVTYVASQIAPIRIEVDDGIAHKLSGPVVGHLPSPIGLCDFDSR